MKIFVSNFARRVGDWLQQNRVRLIKWLLILAAVIALVALLYYGVERWQKAKYEKRVQALEKQFRQAEEQAKAAEAQAELLRRAIDDKYAELKELAARADAAEGALRNARSRVVTLKETYENVRYVPMPAGPVSCADACTDLAAIGYPCK